MVFSESSKDDPMAKDRKNPPLVIFGLDGGDAGLIRQWVHEGHLPTIASDHGTRLHGANRRSGADVDPWRLAFSLQRHLAKRARVLF